MRVWVDCTAAAHPLVLRPIVERLRERGHEVEITAREYGQTSGSWTAWGSSTPSSERTAAARPSARRGRWPGAAARSRRWARQRGFDLALGARLGRPRGRLELLRVPSAQMQDYEHAGLQRQLAFRAARRVLAPDAIPVEAMREAGARRAQAVPLSGPQGGLLPGRLRARPGGPGRARDSTRAACWWWSGRRPSPRPTTPHNPLYDGVLDRLAADGGATAVVIPRTEGQRAEAAERAGRGRGLVVPERAIDAQSLIAFADLVVSAGGTMNREAVALGTPVLHDLQRQAWAPSTRTLIARGHAAPLADPADAASCASASARGRSESPRCRSCWSTRILGAR